MCLWTVEVQTTTHGSCKIGVLLVKEIWEIYGHERSQESKGAVGEMGIIRSNCLIYGLILLKITIY